MGFHGTIKQFLILLLLTQSAFGTIVAPAFRAAGLKSQGTTTAVDVTAATGLVQGDLDILVATNVSGGTMSITTTGGSAWTALPGTPVDAGGGSKLWVWYRITQAGDTDPFVTSSNYVCAARLTYKSGTFDLDTPIDSIATGTDATSSTSFSFATGTSSTTDLSRILCIASTGVNTATPQVPVMANAALAGLTLRINIASTSGTGGGFGATDGTLNSHGLMGTFSCLYATASQKAMVAFAIRPITGVPVKRAGSTAHGTLSAAPANPAGILAGDLDLMVAETVSGQTLSIIAAGGGAWTAVSGTPVTVSGGESLYAWWRISQSSDTAPTVQTTGDHVLATRTDYIPGSGTWGSNPIGASATGSNGTSTTTYSFTPGISPTNAKSLAFVVATAHTTTSAVPSPFTNTTVGTLGQALQVSTTDGTGGALGATDGYRGATADIGTFTATYTATSITTSLALTIKPNSTANASQAFFLW